MNQTRIGLIRCEHCGRQFNPHSGARHIPWCAKQQANSRRIKLSGDKLEALERYKWRINYRPSNQISNSHQSRQPPKHLNLADFARRAKKSSINSSATVSSPSAGSTASIGTSNSLNSNTNDTSHRVRQQLPRSQPPIKTPPPLKRSVSSHTLTRQRGVSHNSAAPAGCALANPSNTNGKTRNGIGVSRTKSVNDLNHMSEIVGILAKRMEEICAQNRILLANLSRFGLNDKQYSSNSIHQESHKTSPLEESSIMDYDQRLNGTAIGLSDNENSIVCHHCKSDCKEESNYCHRCGCKLNCSNEVSSPA